MKALTLRALATGCSCLVLPATAAQPVDPVEPGASVPALVVGEVTVRGRGTGALATRDILTSVDVLGADQVTRGQVNYPWELFGRMPGVMLTEFRQGTTSGKFSLRGFNGEGEVNAVKLLIDGIPSNSNDGNMPYLDIVPLVDIAAIEVVRGTNDPRYGLHNIAGNANVITRTGGNYGTARLQYGSFATRDVQGALGIEQDGISQNYAVAFQRAEGYRDHAQNEKASFAGKWFYEPGDGRFRVGLIARHHWNSAQEPGYLTAADARRDPDQSYGISTTDGGERQANQVSGHLDAELRSDLSLSVKTYLNRLEDQRWVRFSAGVSQQERIVDETHYGLISTLTWRAGATALGDLSVEGGVNVERQENKSPRYTTIDRIRVSTARDQAFTFDNVGGFVQATLRPTTRLRVIPAYRVDTFSGRFTNNLTGAQAAINDYGLIHQPKLSLIYALTDTTSVYGNYGRTFQVGVGAGAYKVSRNTDLGASVNQGWELGAKFAPQSGIEGRIALWQHSASNEARRILNGGANDQQNLGRTRRRGFDLQAVVRPDDRTSAWASYTRQFSKIVEADPLTPASQGKEIDHVPHHLLSAGIDYDATSELRLSGWLNTQSAYYPERTNSTGRFGGYTLVNVAAAYRATRDITLELTLKNLTDRYYEYVWHDNTQTLHSPGEKRALYATMTAKF
jgi:iron complex outermembrane recepter protein